MKKRLLSVLLSFLLLVPGLCWAQKGGFVFMASTIGPIDSGDRRGPGETSLKRRRAFGSATSAREPAQP